MADETGQEFYELVYDADAKEIFQRYWPNCIIADAPDVADPGRFEVRIPGVIRSEVYPRIIREGFGSACLGLSIMMTQEEHRDDVRHWIEKAKELRG